MDLVTMKVVVLLLACWSFALQPSASAYITPSDPSWPSQETFDTELAAAISGTLHGPVVDDNYASLCRTLGTNAYAISAAGDGICMHAHACGYDFCQDMTIFNLPVYTVEPKSPADIGAILQFAEKYNIEVSIKATGHSYVGSSTAKNSLMIWMQNYPKDGTITTNYTDSCGNTDSPAVIGVGGGETWNDVINAVGPDYHVVTGGARTVSAVGGWLQGSGLSFTSRRYGIGVDNVVDFTVVLANGTVVLADACTNPDLFWALRGGGGGTYGVVTNAHYKLHAPTPVIIMNWALLGVDYLLENNLFSDLVGFIGLFQSYWHSMSPTLDSSWGGGFFGPANLYLTYFGSMEDAKTTFLDNFTAWYYNVLVPNTNMVPNVWGAPPPNATVMTYGSWYEVKGGDEAYNNPTLTDPTGDAYEGLPAAIGARLMPFETVASDPDKVTAILTEIITSTGGLGPVNYYLGGDINNIAVDATSVHPAMRKAIYSVFANGAFGQDKLREFIPNTVTGVCYNHHNVLEPDWRNACFGENYDRLLEIKNAVDPNHRFNCWHCVGYEGPEMPSTDVTSTTTTAGTTTTTGTSTSTSTSGACIKSYPAMSAMALLTAIMALVYIF